ncbi:MAG TPA: hypothetical protein DEF82_05220 [Crocinitomicaceae bacterium]|jgi:hypothetical protein|nr:hypothetical protein [Flavobacteriales bacterium]HBW86144.1 hypothetical protein [Crocinitomicaceae bacterium]
MKTKLLILGIFIVQSSSSLFGQISLSSDERLSRAVTNRLKRDLYGYRIQLAFDYDKPKVDLIRQTFLSQFPHIETYITFEAPNFNLKAGNFRTQMEAEVIKEKMVLQYPLNNILKEKIAMPSIN